MKDCAELSICRRPTGRVSPVQLTVIYMWLRYGSMTPSVKAFKKIRITYPGQYCPPFETGQIGHCLYTEKNAFVWRTLQLSYFGTCIKIFLKIINFTNQSQASIIYHILDFLFLTALSFSYSCFSSKVSVVTS